MSIIRQFVDLTEEKRAELAKKLRKLRQETGLSQEKIAYRLGLTTRAYQRYENGAVSVAVGALLAMADFFDVSIDWLLSRDEKYFTGWPRDDDSVI